MPMAGYANDWFDVNLNKELNVAIWDDKKKWISDSVAVERKTEGEYIYMLNYVRTWE